ncbi:unnamed protein product, partial [Owenia fusiformis]
ATRGDMCWTDPNVRQKIEKARQWCRFKNMNNDRITKTIHNWSLTQPRSWDSKVKLELQQEKADHFLTDDHIPSVKYEIKKYRSDLNSKQHITWHNSIWNDSRNQENGNKLRTYRLHKVHKTEPEHYLRISLNRYER